VTAPGTADDGDRRRRDDPLLPLRERAMTGGAGSEAAAVYEVACREHLADVARTYRRDIYYVDEPAAEKIADVTWSRAVARYGRWIEPAGSVSALLARIAQREVVNQTRTGKVTFRGRLQSLDEPISADPDAPGPELSTSGAQAGGHESVRDEDDVAAAAERGRATATARRRLARLQQEAGQPGNCPFHMETGCPHGDRVIDFIRKYVVAGQLLDEAELGTLSEAPAEDVEADLDAGQARRRRVSERIGQVAQAEDLLAADEFERRLVEEGRRLGVPGSGRGAGRQAGAQSRPLSTADQTLNRHFRHCVWWWGYRAFAGTTADETLTGKLRVRIRLINLFRLKPDGGWQSSACPKEGAMHMLATDPEFGRLLLWLHEAGRKPLGAGTYKEIHDSLGRRAS
jgi:DNA-directed RNA polymerase specialized sigma24 family protein